MANPFVSYRKNQKIDTPKRGTGDVVFETWLKTFTKGERHDPDADLSDIITARTKEAEAKELLARVATLQQEAADHRNSIIRRNARMILSQARRAAEGKDIPVADLWQSGVFGAMEGLQKYDPEHRTENGTTKVASYLFSWVKKYIILDIEDAASPVKVPRAIERIHLAAKKLRGRMAQELEMDEALIPMDMLVERLLEMDNKAVLAWKKKLAKKDSADLVQLTSGIIAAFAPARSLSLILEEEQSLEDRIADEDDLMTRLDNAFAKSDALRMKGVFMPLRDIVRKLDNQTLTAHHINRIVKIFEPQKKATIELLSYALTDDGGLEYHSEEFLDACIQMGISHPEAVGRVATLMATLAGSHSKPQTAAAQANLFS